MADYGDREIILADFQAVTGIDNLDECIELLNQHDWDLMSCVNAVFANQSTDQNNSEECVVTRSVHSQAQPSETDEASGRKLIFNVAWKEGTVTVTVDDISSVDTLKKLLEMQLGVPKSSQTLSQWPTGQTVSDGTILSTLNLKEETSLVLTARGGYSAGESSAHCSSAVRNGGPSSRFQNDTSKVNLKIRYEDKLLELSHPESKTMGEVKSGVRDVTNVEVRHQEWSGLPGRVNNQVSQSVITVESDNEDDEMEVCDGSSDDAVEIELEVDDDDDDLIMTDFPVRKTIKELMPPYSIDNRETSNAFMKNFEERYGVCHPHFYIGSLNEALDEANAKSAKERWPLLVYLHHDSSILTNVFCSQILCEGNMVAYISQNFVSWAWDMTHDTNKSLLLDIVTQKCGSGAADTVRQFNSDEYPLVLVVMKNRSALEVSAVLQGRVTLDECMTGLMNAREVFDQAREADIREEAEREAREAMRREQDEAYQESLRADRAKEEERERQESEALRVKKETEEKAFLEAQTKQAQIMSLEDQLPDEPGPDCLEPISNLRFRLPNNQQITRRFLACSSLQVVLTFVQSKGYLEDQYTVVTNFPRKLLSQLDPKQSLESLGLYPQETLFVEEI